MARYKTIAILTHFEDLSDPRIDRTKQHVLLDMVTIALVAAICGANTWADVERFGNAKEEWFAKFLELPNGIPSHDTFGRVFARLDTEEFYACLHNWVRSLNLDLKGRGVALDGKAIRHSFDTASGKSALHIVSAWVSDLGIALGQIAVDEKSNEIPAVPQLLVALELTGAVVTVDAMHCQKETAAAILAKDADYVFTVKANQPTLYQAMLDLFAAYGENNYQSPELRTHTTVDRSHGRIERRTYYVAPAPAEWISRGEWPGLKSVAMVYRSRNVNGKISEETAYIITSLPPKPKTLAKHIRGHWGIENNLHWTLDVTFAEDQSRIRKGNGQEIAGVFRRLALTMLMQDTSIKSSLRGKRLMAGWNNEILEGILCGFQGD
jgi:predicted transposase YbfD/YdcC